MIIVVIIIVIIIIIILLGVNNNNDKTKNLTGPGRPINFRGPRDFINRRGLLIQGGDDTYSITNRHAVK